MQLQLEGVRQLSSRDFLLSLKLKSDIDSLSYKKAKKDTGGKKEQLAAVDKLAENAREGFISQARASVVNIIESLLGDIRLTAHIVRGMASFDPTVLSSQPMDQVLFCFSSLFSTFQLRGWVDESSAPECRDEYVGFVDDFRNLYPDLISSPDLIRDVVTLLTGMPALYTRPHLFHLFRLSCVCLTEISTSLPAIKFHSADSSDVLCRLSDVLFPAQAYLAYVPGSVNDCVTEAALTRYHLLEAKFSSGNVSGDPWSHVDSFGQSSIHKELLAAFKVEISGAGTARAVHFAQSSEPSEAGGTPFSSPGKSTKFAYFGNLPSSEIDKTIKELQQGSSKH